MRGDKQEYGGRGQPLPTFYLKVPTGGGKTLLAVKTTSKTLIRKDDRRNT